ncbi:hypothetical protein PSD17_01640 [Pseudonocardia sp. D17]|nr:hypothetical protein PSD17_01640 [Pseudonocardia sp. D17]
MISRFAASQSCRPTSRSRATAATLRRRLFTIPGRLVHTARRLHLRLPANWPWADAFLTALTRGLSEREGHCLTESAAMK